MNTRERERENTRLIIFPFTKNLHQVLLRTLCDEENPLKGRTRLDVYFSRKQQH